MRSQCRPGSAKLVKLVMVASLVILTVALACCEGYWCPQGRDPGEGCQVTSSAFACPGGGQEGDCGPGLKCIQPDNCVGQTGCLGTCFQTCEIDADCGGGTLVCDVPVDAKNGGGFVCHLQ